MVKKETSKGNGPAMDIDFKLVVRGGSWSLARPEIVLGGWSVELQAAGCVREFRPVSVGASKVQGHSTIGMVRKPFASIPQSVLPGPY